jgi:hypothetical protein
VIGNIIEGSGRSETQENQNNVLWKQTGGFGRNLGTVSFQHPVPK